MDLNQGAFPFAEGRAVREIPLSRPGFVAVVDDADAALVSQFKWHLRVKGVLVKRNYAAANVRKEGRPTTLYMHRLIAGDTFGKVVDHVDGDGLNNCRSNLRLATHSQNGANRTHRSFAKSGYFGVVHRAYSQNKGRRFGRNKPWQATITLEGRVVSLGYFETVEDAIAARKAAEAMHPERIAQGRLR